MPKLQLRGNSIRYSKLDSTFFEVWNQYFKQIIIDFEVIFPFHFRRGNWCAYMCWTPGFASIPPVLNDQKMLSNFFLSLSLSPTTMLSLEFFYKKPIDCFFSASPFDALIFYNHGCRFRSALVELHKAAQHQVRVINLKESQL